MGTVTFLFGAGAEVSYGMKQGLEFLEYAVMGKEAKDQRLDALEKFFKRKKVKNSYSRIIVFDKSKFLKTCVFNKALDHTDSENNYLNKYKDQIFCILSESSRKELTNELGIEDVNYWDKCGENLLKQKENKNNSSSEIYKMARDIRTKLEEKFEKAIQNGISFEELIFIDELGNSFDILQSLFEEKELKKENKKILELKVNLPAGGLLDSYFHTIINPEKYGIRNFFKVFNYYWFCYFTMVEDIINSDVIDTSSLKKYYTEVPCESKDKQKQKRELKYYDIINNISDFTRDLYKLDVTPTNNTYYKLLKEKYNSSKTKPYIITTNYYKFCEILVDSEKDNLIYLNGQLKDFEFPFSLEVKDFEKTNDLISSEKLFFPFVWGQSYVKPIVHSSQIQQYARLSKILKKTDTLVILGYNINEDDNHINSFLREYVIRKGKRLIVVISKDVDVAKKLKCLEEDVNINYCKVDYKTQSNEEILEKLYKMMD